MDSNDAEEGGSQASGDNGVECRTPGSKIQYKNMFSSLLPRSYDEIEIMKWESDMFEEARRCTFVWMTQKIPVRRKPIDLCRLKQDFVVYFIL